MTFAITPTDRLNALYPDETPVQMQERLDAMVGWVAYYAPCTARPEFVNDGPGADLIRDLIYRAMKYQKETDDGLVVSRSAGSFSRTIDTRRPSSPTPFAADQVTILRSLCAASTQPGPVSIPLGPSNPRWA